ncbi:proto-oncogene DBL-like isoform X6 [Entelurus aequoreus]|uniref:proto-oncogene DBL-like isoform X6 n=1 Tax=Entelurus aequoreus TaxID=161455 RepID=UPI002B1E198D|nr:proto-oncogene DBL-like isoform X6 [Entelurus aequoreus]
MAEWGFPRLRRAATSFPGNLHLVLVLRPSTLLGSAPSPSSSTDLGFRFSQDDFLLKMPAVMLRSVGDLLRYIDDNRLTSGLCGTAERCRSDWIVLRSAIETFAVTVKEVAQLLQGFGSELSDGELPDEANAIDFLLRSHTQRYRHMKSDIRGVLKEGRLLLDNLETLKVSKRTVEDQKEEEEEDVQADMDTVQRLLAQLRDMEEAFDGFFDKHHLKMQQYHQLILYESSFQQMEEELEKISAEEKAILSVGSTLMHTEQLLKDLNTLDQRAQEGMARAQVLLLHGHQLAANHHYALALIIQRCNELRHHCDVITSGVRSKRASLTRTRDLLLRLDEALRWCDEGAYLLASQMVDKFQTREGAQEALHYLSCHQERAPPVIKNKQDFPSLEFEAILTPQLQDQISMVMDKLTSVQAMMRNREQCLRKMADVRVRPVQLVAPRPEAEQTLQRCKSPLFTPKHGVDFNLLNSKFSFDLLPGKRTSRRSGGQRKIEVMHDYHGNRSTLYGSAPDTDSEAEDNPEQITRRVMKELIYTEKIYVDELLAVLLGYRAEMEDPSMAYLLPSLLLSQKDILFGNMPEIYQFHSRIFLQDLQRCLDTPERVGGCFLLRKDKFQVYERYCQNKPRSESLWRQCSDSAFFQECQKKLDHKLALDSYLLKPVQRLTKYQLLLKELLKHCTQLQYRTQLQEALDCMLDLLKSLNDSMHQTAITGYQVDHGQKCCSSRLVHKGETFMISLLLPVYYSIHFHTVRRYESDDAMFQGDLGGLGRVLLQGGFSVWVSHKRAAVLARFKPMQRHVFLYERALLFCKRRDERTPVYSFKSCLRMDSVRVTESVKGDGKKFEMCDTAGHEVYVLQAPSVEVKDTWLSELHKIISQQQKGQVAGVSEPLFSDSASEVCVSWGGASSGGCSACLPVTHSSSATSHAHRWEEFVHTSPAHSDPVVHSPRRGWPVAAHSVAICDGLEDWGATDLSDSEDEDDLPAPLVPGRYRVLVASSMASSDDIIFNCGDVIQLMHEDVSGMWLVRNVSRGEEGRVLPEDLHRILGETC